MPGWEMKRERERERGGALTMAEMNRLSYWSVKESTKLPGRQ